MNKNYVPEWKLEWYLLGVLPAKEQRAFAALEQTDAELRGRLDALRASNAEILAAYPPEAMVDKLLEAAAVKRTEAADVINPPTEKKKPVRRPGTARSSAPMRGARLPGLGFGIPRWANPVFACAALMLTAVPVWMYLASEGGAEDTATYNTRTKGTAGAELAEPSLEVWRKAGNDAEMLEPDAAVHTGDVVQLRYIVPAPCYGALVSMDGRGVLTVHLSGSDGKAAPLIAGRPVALKTSYKLDDAPAFEAFYLITASDNFELESVRRKLLSATHPIDGEQDLSLQEKQVTAFTLRKTEGGAVN